MTKDCMLLRYQIYILTSCEFVDDFYRWGYSLISEIMDMHIASRTFCSSSATHFHHHGIDASAFLPLDWIVDEHSENLSLPERPDFCTCGHRPENTTSQVKCLIPISQRAAKAVRAKNFTCACGVLWCCSSDFSASGWADIRIRGGPRKKWSMNPYH